MMKPIWTIVLVLLAPLAWAQPDLTLSNVNATPGSTVNIDFTFNNGAPPNDVSVMMFDISYDPAVLTPGTVVAGPDLAGADLLTALVVAPGTLRINISNIALAPIASGVLATIPFTVAANATPGNQSLSLTNVSMLNTNGNPVTANALNNGSINVLAVNNAVPVPSLGAWGLIMLSALLGLFGIRRRCA